MADSKELPPPVPPNKLKKTRDLPNLSDCNCCNRRINSTNPKNRLQILASEWRIVLLCKSCYNLVETSQNCSYCLSRVSCSSMESYIDCKRCHRRIHKDCVSMFSFDSINYGRNCYNFDDFKVCFDCWLPKLVENDYYGRVFRSRSERNEVRNGDEKVKGEMAKLLGSSRVSDLQGKKKVLENVANDGQVVAKRKVVVAREGKGKGLSTDVGEKRPIVCGISAVGLGSVKKDGNQRGGKVVEDAQLAFRLHRRMNSSPRISRYSCSLNTHCLDVPEVSEGHMDGLDSGTDVGTSCGTKPRKHGDDERNGLSEVTQVYERKRARNQDEKRNEGSAGSLITYCRKGRALLEVKEELDCSMRTDIGGLLSENFVVKEEADCSLMTYRRRLPKPKMCKRELGQCSKTYKRRHSAIPYCESKMICGVNLDNGALTPTFDLNCCEESRTFTTAS